MLYRDPGRREVDRRLENPWIRKFELFTSLSSNERAALAKLCSSALRRIGPRQDLIAEGQPHHKVFVVLDGWASRYKMLEDGRRQIVGLLLPGDMSDPHSYLLRGMDHSVGSISRMRLAELPHEQLHRLIEESPRLRQAVRWSEMVTVATQREWTLNLGQRSALERVSHFLCETFLRLETVGLTQGDSCDFPLVQNELADIAGLTPVHINRTLQELRRLNLIVLENRRLTIPDMPRLKSAGLFNDNYLHIRREGAHLDANE